MEAPFHTPVGTPMLSELSGYAAEIDRVNADVQRVTAGLGHEQYNWRPEPHRWSIAEHVDHLTLITQEYVPALDDAIAVGQARSMYSEDRFFRYGVIDRLVVWSMEPPVRVRLPAPRRVRPGSDRALATALPAFLAAQEELRARVQRANGLDLSIVKVRSPFVRQLSITLGKAFAALLAHERRHLWHMTAVRQAPGFPGY